MWIDKYIDRKMDISLALFGVVTQKVTICEEHTWRQGRNLGGGGAGGARPLLHFKLWLRTSL